MGGQIHALLMLGRICNRTTALHTMAKAGLRDATFRHCDLNQWSVPVHWDLWGSCPGCCCLGMGQHSHVAGHPRCQPLLAHLP